MHRLKLQIVVIILFSVVSLALIAAIIQQNIKIDEQQKIANLLHVVLDNSQQAVSSWVNDQKVTVMTWVNTAEIRDLTQRLVDLSADDRSLKEAPSQKSLQKYLNPFLKQSHYNSFIIISRDRKNLAASDPSLIGKTSRLVDQELFFHDILIGESAVSLPVTLNVHLPESNISTPAKQIGGVTSLYIGAPVLGDRGQVIAVFAFQIHTTEVFNEIFQRGRFGVSGETYAFDQYARMISNSRFDEELRNKGLIGKNQNGIFNLEIRDPGTEIKNINDYNKFSSSWPLTRMVASAIAGQSGIDLEGYRDYRGVEVVGAWKWNSQLGIGIATEIDKAEAYQSFYTYRVIIIMLTLVVAVLTVFLILLFVISRQRRSAIQQMKNSETRFRTLLESVAEGVFGVDLDGQCTFINQSGLKLLGYDSSDELVNKHIHSVIHHTKLDGNVCPDQTCRIYAAFRQGKQFYVNDEILWRKNGSYFIVEYRSNPVYVNGVVTGSVVSFADITTRRQAEHALRINEKKYRQMFNAMLDVYAEIGTDGTILEVTPSVEAQTGYTREEILGRHMEEFYAQPGDREKLLQKIYYDGYINDYEVSLIDKSGNVRACSFTGKIIFDDNGKPEKLAGVMRDITNRKQFEQQLQNSKHDLELRVQQRTAELQISNQELRHEVEERKQVEAAVREEHAKQHKILDTVEAIIVELDKNGCISLINRKGCQLLGYDRQQLMGKNWFATCLPQPQGNERVAPFYEKIMAGFLPFVEYQESYIVNKDGEKFLIAWHNSHYIDDSGNIIGMLSAGEDITHRVKMEEQARDRLTQMAHMTRLNMMGEMATGIAHELNQPLTAIATYADVAERMLKQGLTPPEKLLEIIKASREQANRAAEIIRHLRQLVNKTTPHKVKVNINEIIKESIILLNHDLNKHHVKLVLELDESIPRVVADRIQIEQVIINLVNNSIDALKRIRQNTRKITIRTELKRTDAIQVSITDSGPGVNETSLHHIFEPFVTTKGDVGMGMGLTISRSIIEVHNGRIGIDTKQGQGAHFYFTLPVVTEFQTSEIE